jgi:hypothetical protein
MPTLRMSVLALLLALSTSALSQTEQTSYQCSSDGSLNGGFLVYTVGDLEAVAKYKDGTVSDISGIIGRAGSEQRDLRLLPQIIRSYTYADAAQSTMMLQEAPDRDDIEAGVRVVTSKPGDHVPPKAGDKVGRKLGEQVPPKAGDQAPVLRPGAQILFRDPPPAKTGELVLKPNIITFSAHLNQQGNISDISYRRKRGIPVVIHIDAKTPTSNDRVFTMLNGALSGIKTLTTCCAPSAGAHCRSGNSPSAQMSLRTGKPAIQPNSEAGGSMLMSPYGRTPGSEAK